MNILITATFSNSPFSGKTSSPVKYSYLPTFPKDKTKTLTVFYINHIELCFALFSYCFYFLANSHFIIAVLLNLNELSDGNVVSITKNDSLVYSL